MALHTMAILQAYQADVLKEMDEGTGLTPEAVKELRSATDLALRATKHTARAVGRYMVQWPQSTIYGSIWDLWEGEGVPAGRIHLKVWVIRGGG